MNEREDTIRELFGTLWRFFQRRAQGDIDDLIQQTFTDYFEQVERTGSVRHPKAYVLRVARSVLFRHYRDRGPFDPITQSLADVTTSVSSHVARAQAHDVIQAAMRSLPYALFEVIDLYYGEELRGPTLAAALGIPEGTVRSRLRRARDQLRVACTQATCELAHRSR